MKFSIREMDWYKRRAPTRQPKPTSVECNDFQLIENHYCNLHVTYDDGNLHHLTGRVSRNDITGKWTCHGTDPHGRSVLLDCIE